MPDIIKLTFMTLVTSTPVLLVFPDDKVTIKTWTAVSVSPLFYTVLML